MTEGRTRRLQKLQQLWAQVVSQVEAERRVRTADVSSVASVDPRSSSSSTGPNARCLQQRLSHGERIPDEEERRYYCPELCNTGIFRHPDGSIRPYPPPVANDKSEQRRRFVESQQRRMRERRDLSRNSDMSSDSDSEEENSTSAAAPSSSGCSSKRTLATEAAPTKEAVEDFLASIPLPDEPPPPAAISPQAPTTAERQQTASAPVAMPFLPFPFPVPPPVGAYGAGSQPSSTGAPQGGPQGPPGFFSPGFVPPFVAIPAPPSQLLAHMQQMQQQPGQQQPEQQQPQQVQQPQQRIPQQDPLEPHYPATAGPPNVHKRPPAQRTPLVPPKKQQTVSRPAEAADLKAAMAFVPTHLRTKKLPATAKAREGPSISQVSAYSMGAAALGRQVCSAGASSDKPVSGLARFLGESKVQQEGSCLKGPPKAPAPADLDRAFDEFLKEVGAS
ncbi:hypothetical protein, conserved [Eimeria tenella]|uniref:Uncharacterized protein n=1 Tax=Eimeria tenella TaxID=5802 RepID=U6KQ20_EIMTE|nr:hypothetical protein, conserved [Eimeria tenella]CDJ38357.1 hypothetical protein, conserved [Eimeria tenella]|eukprot:XP_013229195.1 hypothetical protein, conserved [Eimeria tenella]